MVNNRLNRYRPCGGWSPSGDRALFSASRRLINGTRRRTSIKSWIAEWRLIVAQMREADDHSLDFGASGVRYVICFVGLFAAFMLFMYPTKEKDEAAYNRLQLEYEAALNGPVKTLSGVNFYPSRNRNGPSYIFYRPGGRDVHIACIRCPVDWQRFRAQIVRLDFVTLPDGSKLAVEMRLKSGQPIMDRATALREIRYVRDFNRDLIGSKKARDRGIGLRMLLSMFCALVLTGLYALSRLNKRASTRQISQR